MNIQLDPGAYMPDRAHVPDAGADLFTPVGFTLYGNSHKTIDTGVHIEIPYGYVGMVKSKSGLMLEGIVTDGTVDSGYTGSIRVVLFNHSKHSIDFKAGEKIAQLVIMKIVSPAFEQVEKVSGGDRGDSGFGSTGKKRTPLSAPEKPEGVPRVLGTPSSAIPLDYIIGLIRDPANAGMKSSVLSWLLQIWRER